MDEKTNDLIQDIESQKRKDDEEKEARLPPLLDINDGAEIARYIRRLHAENKDLQAQLAKNKEHLAALERSPAYTEYQQEHEGYLTKSAEERIKESLSAKFAALETKNTELQEKLKKYEDTPKNNLDLISKIKKAILPKGEKKNG